MKLIYSEKFENAIINLQDGDLVCENADATVECAMELHESFSIFENAFEVSKKAFLSNSNIYHASLHNKIIFLISKDEDEALAKISNWKWDD